LNEYKIIVKRAVYNDIDGIFNYIANELAEPHTANNLCNSIEDAFESLQYLPLRFPLIDSQQIHKMPVGNYLVFYQVDEDAKEVRVVRVMHGRRDFGALI